MYSYYCPQACLYHIAWDEDVTNKVLVNKATLHLRLCTDLDSYLCGRDMQSQSSDHWQSSWLSSQCHHKVGIIQKQSYLTKIDQMYQSIQNQEGLLVIQINIVSVGQSSWHFMLFKLKNAFMVHAHDHTQGIKDNFNHCFFDVVTLCLFHALC